MSALMVENIMNTQQLDKIHHVAIVVEDIERAIQWYQSQFKTKLVYADDTWAMLAFV